MKALLLAAVAGLGLVMGPPRGAAAAEVPQVIPLTRSWSDLQPLLAAHTESVPSATAACIAFTKVWHVPLGGDQDDTIQVVAAFKHGKDAYGQVQSQCNSTVIVRDPNGAVLFSHKVGFEVQLGGAVALISLVPGSYQLALVDWSFGGSGGGFSLKIVSFSTSKAAMIFGLHGDANHFDWTVSNHTLQVSGVLYPVVPAGSHISLAAQRAASKMEKVSIALDLATHLPKVTGTPDQLAFYRSIHPTYTRTTIGHFALSDWNAHWVATADKTRCVPEVSVKAMNNGTDEGTAPVLKASFLDPDRHTVFGHAVAPSDNPLPPGYSATIRLTSDAGIAYTPEACSTWQLPGLVAAIDTTAEPSMPVAQIDVDRGGAALWKWLNQ